jgi:AraC family transcriptional regulator
MTQPASAGARAVDHALAWIETRLDAPLSLDAIAAEAGLSPYHFSRLFTARLGRSVMAYVRGRKLIAAARRLTADPDLKLVDLALDCGFESQEAFTRAFTRVFGVAPGRFRKGFSAAPIEGQVHMTTPHAPDANVIQTPELVTLEAFTVAGVARRVNEATKASIPDLWPRLIAVLPFEGQTPSWVTYGVEWGADRIEGSFNYMAAVGVKPDAVLPDGFERLDIPAATYVVFRITLAGGAVHPQVKAAMAKIWGELIPASEFKLTGGPDFESYSGNFEPTRPGAVIDYHVPVVV